MQAAEARNPSAAKILDKSSKQISTGIPFPAKIVPVAPRRESAPLNRIPAGPRSLIDVDVEGALLRTANEFSEIECHGEGSRSDGVTQAV